VDQIYNNEEDISECGMIFNQIREILKLFPFFHIQYGRRQVNLVVHSLARNYMMFDVEHTYNMISQCIQHIISIMIMLL